jgi:hypothetical protein
MPMSLSTLDLYLAHAFIPYPAVWAELAERGADPVDAGAVWRWILSMSTHRLEDNTLAKYTELFGPASDVREGAHCWSLELWPDHQWVLTWGETDWNITSIGIARRIPGQPQRVSPLSIDGAQRALRLGYDTIAEVQAALGDSDRYDGWWPWDSWEYDVADGSVLQCDFAHNILVAITPERLRDPIVRRTHTSPDRPLSSS